MAKGNSTLLPPVVKHLPEYQIWKQMRYRCSNPRTRNYHNYGGRGIKVCGRWSVFKNFWEDMGPRPATHYSLDRIDNDGNYEPDNCRWATPKQQGRNARYNRILTHNGRSMCLADWSEATGIRHSIIRKRLTRGWPVDLALTTPALAPHSVAKQFTFEGITQSLPNWAKQFSIDIRLLRYRLRSGWSFERSLRTPVRHRATR